MELEILLDVEEVKPEHMGEVLLRFKKWYDEGSEVRHGRPRFEHLHEHEEKPFRYTVNLGHADHTRALQQLHGRLFPYGAKVFVHFIH